MRGLRLSTESREGSVIVTITGDLDSVTCPYLDECVTEARREHRHVVLDMTGVGFMDTSSLAVIVGHWKKLAAAGGELALAGVQYRGAKALWITGLAERLPLYDTVAEAISARPALRPEGMGTSVGGATEGGTATRRG